MLTQTKVTEKIPHGVQWGNGCNGRTLKVSCQLRGPNALLERKQSREQMTQELVWMYR